ncbi:ABC transporter ATP-binding protein, partial [Desulfoluna sp.]|uniref:ABC transporter ATP-binding protein n=1 Tax=Desulfoluna sp. TaxID=2045199 RepID=UPI0026159CFF
DSVLHIEGISFKRGNREGLKGIDAHIENGLFHAILGPNGVGKSTLIEILAGQLEPDSGTTSLFGTPMKKFSARTVAQNVAVVAQSHDVRFAFSVRDVVMMGRHPHIDRFGSPSTEDFRLAEEAMAVAEIHHLADRPITEVSGGERQRTLFARALAQDTPVLILDEATSNLDMKHTLSLLSVVREKVKRENRCAVGVFQDINTAALFCDRFLFLKEGKVAVSGSVEETITPEILWEVFGVKARVMEDAVTHSRQVLFSSGGFYG